MLPSGSARTCQFSVPVCPTSAGLAPRASSRSNSASWSRSVALTSMCNRSLPVLGVPTGDNDERGLRAAEAGVGRPDLDGTVILPAELDVTEDLAPECGKPVGIGGIEHELTDAARHARECTWYSTPPRISAVRALRVSAARALRTRWQCSDR
jgi:hypothetical protein